jgi:hypothetical protein
LLKFFKKAFRRNLNGNCQRRRQAGIKAPKKRKNIQGKTCKRGTIIK